MASCYKHHQELTDGVGKCCVPLWSGGVPGGFCDEDAYGVQTEEGKQRLELAFEYHYAPYLVCPNHGGPMQRLDSSGVEE